MMNIIFKKLNDEDVQANDSPINSGQDNENELNKKDEEIEDAHPRIRR